MANVRKKISELTPLNSASLDTTIVGVDNGTTYKIELDTLADAVTNRVNTLDRDRLSSLESVTSSFETKGRSILSGSVSYTSLTNIPQGIVSQSTDLSSLNQFTASISTASLVTSINNLNTFTASQSTSSLVNRLNAIESISGSWITESETGSFAITGSNVFKGQQIVSGSFIVSISENAFGVNENPTPNNIFWSYIPNDTNTTSIESGWIVNIETVGTYTVTDVEYDYPFVKITLDDVLLELPYRCNGYFSLPSSELKFGTDGVLKISGSLSVSGSITGSTNFNTIVNKPTLISGSSQLTSSYDTRYVISGSITQTTWDNIASKPAGIISSSAQITAFGFVSGSYLTSLSGAISSSSELTSSYDTRYVLSSSFSTISSSFNSRFNGLVTTGSNTFSGSQVFSGSMIVTSGQVIASSITANTSSLYLTSGSNMYVQNNGVVEITGSLNVSGSANFNVASLNINGRGGDEGGEINLAVPVTNTTLSTRVVADIYQNRFRIFDGNTNGVYIDISKAPTGVAGEITYKASGYVNAGTFVQLDNLKATIPTSGNRSISIATVSGTFSGYVSASYTLFGGGVQGMGATITVTTTPALAINWNFTAQGDAATYIITDNTNSRTYRITMIIGGGYNNNFISIERLH